MCKSVELIKKCLCMCDKAVEKESKVLKFIPDYFKA